MRRVYTHFSAADIRAIAQQYILYAAGSPGWRTVRQRLMYSCVRAHGSPLFSDILTLRGWSAFMISNGMVKQTKAGTTRSNAMRG